MQWFSACISKYQFKYCLFAFLLSLSQCLVVQIQSCLVSRTCSFAIVDLNFLSTLFILFIFPSISNIRTVSYQLELNSKNTSANCVFSSFLLFFVCWFQRGHITTESNRSCKVSFHLFPYELPKCIKIFDLPSQLKHLYGLFHGRFMQERFVSFPCICVSVKHPFIHMDAMSSLLLSNFRTLLLNVDNTV